MSEQNDLYIKENVGFGRVRKCHNLIEIFDDAMTNYLFKNSSFLNCARENYGSTTT